MEPNGYRMERVDRAVVQLKQLFVNRALGLRGEPRIYVDKFYIFLHFMLIMQCMSLQTYHDANNTKLYHYYALCLSTGDDLIIFADAVAKDHGFLAAGRGFFYPATRVCLRICASPQEIMIMKMNVMVCNALN